MSALEEQRTRDLERKLFGVPHPQENAMAEPTLTPVTVANAEENKRLGSIAPESPTGTPVLPPKWAFVAAIVVGLSSILAIIPGMPALVVTICGIVVSLGVVLGIASPGVRK
jgi:hypothetical protein